MDLDPAQQRELEFLRSQIRPRRQRLIDVLVAAPVFALAALFIAWQAPDHLAVALLAAALLMAVFLVNASKDPEPQLERLVRLTVASDDAIRRGANAVQRDGVRNRPSDEPPTPKYWR
jgi:histidinol-phosphate/aromatic aminotransferase/cobyric acid decarboxylase-like protein